MPRNLPLVDTEDCEPAGDLIDVPGAERVAAVAKALSDPVRVRVLHHIATSGRPSVCACHLTELFGVSQPTLSHHLRKLVEAGLVTREMRGRWAHFAVRPEGLQALRRFLADVPGGADAG